MNVNYEILDDLHGCITVALEENDYADKVKKQLKEIAKNHQEPGFRRGNVPMAIISRKYGTGVKYEVVNKEISNALFNYIKDNNLDVLGNPVPEKDNDFNIESKDFNLKFRIGLAPKFDDPVNKELHVPYYTIKVDDKMVDDEVARLRDRFGRQVPGEEVEPNALVKGVITELNDDHTVKEGGIVVENGILSPMYFTSDEQRALFMGQKPGNVVVFNPYATCNGNAAELSSMLNVDKEKADSYKGDFQMEIREVIVLRPAEMNQEFFDNVLGKEKADSEEAFRNEISGVLKARLVNDSTYRFQIDAKDAVLNAIGDLQLPEDILKDFLIAQSDDKKITEENVDEKYNEFKPAMIWDIVRNRISADLKVVVGEEELLNAARQIVYQQMMQYGIANLDQAAIDNYAKEILKDRNAGVRLHDNVLTQKLFHSVKEAVSLDEKEVSVDEFRALFNAEEKK